MLTAVRKSDNQRVDAKYTIKGERPFLCPKCKHEVFLKKGIIREHHFAHRPDSNCDFGGGETESHRKCKRTIFESIKSKEDTKNFELERVNLKTVYPDISGRIRDIPIAIEVQRSTIDLKIIIHRTQEYTKKGIYILWVLIWNEKLNIDRYSPRIWERYLHDLYKGRVYYWTDDINVIPYHYEDYYFYREPQPYFDKFGEEHYPGSYYELSKRYIKPVAGKK